MEFSPWDSSQNQVCLRFWKHCVFLGQKLFVLVFLRKERNLRLIVDILWVLVFSSLFCACFALVLVNFYPVGAVFF